jgi:N-acetylmuramic acid 6-phosphate etherase
MAPLNLSALQTESRNLHAEKIDTVSTMELCQIINSQDALVAPAVESCLGFIADAIDRITERVRRGGRMISVGSGTSGR